MLLWMQDVLLLCKIPHCRNDDVFQHSHQGVLLNYTELIRLGLQVGSVGESTELEIQRAQEKLCFFRVENDVLTCFQSALHLVCQCFYHAPLCIGIH